MYKRFDFIPNLYRLIKILWQNLLLDWQQWFFQLIKWKNRSYYNIKKEKTDIYNYNLINLIKLFQRDKQKYNEITELTNFDNFIVIENAKFCNIDSFTNIFCQDFLQDDNIYQKKIKYWKFGIWIDNQNGIIIFTIIQINNDNPLQLKGYIINNENISFIVKKLIHLINLSILQYWELKFF